MVEGLFTKQEKPSNTEVLGLLMDKDKLEYITSLNGTNVKGLCRIAYLTKRLRQKDKSSVDITDEILTGQYLALKCSQQNKKGTRADLIADAIKHSPEPIEKDKTANIAQQIKS